MFNFLTKQTFSIDCKLNSKKGRYPQVTPLRKGVFLIAKHINAAPTQYRIFSEDGVCWSVYEGYNFNFISIDEQNDHVVAGLDDYVYIFDIKTGTVKDKIDLIGEIDQKRFSLSYIINNKLFLFRSGKIPGSYASLAEVDLQKREIKKFYFKENLYFSFSEESKSFFKDYLNNIYKFDPNSPEISLSKADFTVNKECRSFSYLKKNKLFMCENFMKDGKFVFSFFRYKDSSLFYPWGHNVGEYAVWSQEKNLFIKSNATNLDIYDLKNQKTINAKANDRILGLFVSDNGNPYFATEEGIYFLNYTGDIKQLFKFTKFTYDNRHTVCNMTADDLLTCSIANYEERKVAFYSTQIK